MEMDLHLDFHIIKFTLLDKPKTILVTILLWYKFMFDFILNNLHSKYKHYGGERESKSDKTQPLYISLHHYNMYNHQSDEETPTMKNIAFSVMVYCFR